MNQQCIAHVGYRETSRYIQELFSTKTLILMSKLITENLRDIAPFGIVVPLDIIANILNALYESYRPPIELNRRGESMYTTLVKETVNNITQQIRDETIMNRNAAKLTVWSTVLGSQHSPDLRAHPEIKTKDSLPFAFNVQL